MKFLFPIWQVLGGVFVTLKGPFVNPFLVLKEPENYFSVRSCTNKKSFKLNDLELTKLSSLENAGEKNIPTKVFIC